MGKFMPIHGNPCQKPLDSSSKKVDEARLNAHSKALALRFEDGHHENKIGMQALKSFLLRAIKVRYKLIPTLCSFVRKFHIIFHKQVPLLVGFADFFPGLATLCGLLWVSQSAHEIVQTKKTQETFDSSDIHDVKIFEGIPVI